MSFTKIYNRQRFLINWLSIIVNPFYFIRKGLLNGIKKYAHSLNGKLLDFGCGSKPYRSLFKVDEYIGLDIENKGHPHLNEDIDVFYDGKKIPFADNHFDSVFCTEVFEHIFNLDEIIMEIKRVIRTDGKLLVTVPFVWNEHEVPYDYGRYSAFGIEDLLKKNGFEILEIYRTTNFVETISQTWILYIYHITQTKNKFLTLFFQLVFIFPFTVIGVLLSAILPKRKDFYHNTVVLARKK